MKKICVIGYPAKHSLSPAIHKYWLEKYGITGDYEIKETHPDNFVDFFCNMQNQGYCGCNITVPFKEKAFDLLVKSGGSLDVFAEVVGAINTIAIKEGKYIGRNSDTTGFLYNIISSKPDFSFTAGKAVILGAGGAARGVIASLLFAGVPEIIILNRTALNAINMLEYIKKEAIKLADAEDLDNIPNMYNLHSQIQIWPWDKRDEALKDANLLVNTTSLGMVGQPQLDINLNYLPQSALVTDIVYRPLITQLLQTAKDKNNPIIDGLGMLLYQATTGFEDWFGVKPEVTPELRNKITALL